MGTRTERGTLVLALKLEEGYWGYVQVLVSVYHELPVLVSALLVAPVLDNASGPLGSHWSGWKNIQ